MKKFLILIFALSFFLSGCNNNENQDSYNASRTATSLNEANNSVDNSTSNNNVENSTDNSVDNTASSDKSNNNSELSSFSTKVYTPNDKARQNNIQITCSSLNETVVKSRRNFFIL